MITTLACDPERDEPPAFPLESPEETDARARHSKFMGYGLGGLTPSEALGVLETILTTSADALAGVSKSGAVTLWGAGAEALLGYTSGEMIGQPIEVLFAPARADKETAILPSLTKCRAIARLETSMRHKTNGEIPVSLSASPVRNEAGAVVGNILTIREKATNMTADAHAQLTAAEVNHRIKNLFAVITAIARMTIAPTRDDFILRFMDRLQAFSESHDLLFRNQWERIGLAELAGLQLAHFKDLFGTRILLSGGLVQVNAEAAQAIGMALHELATNSGKYGALSGPTGRVALTWSIANGTLRIAWSESDGPTVSPPHRRGFGRTVIEDMTRMKLGGTSVLVFASGGVCWTLECPASRAGAG